MAALAGGLWAWVGGKGDVRTHKAPVLAGIDNLGDRGSLDIIFVSQARNNDRCDR